MSGFTLRNHQRSYNDNMITKKTQNYLSCSPDVSGGMLPEREISRYRDGRRIVGRLARKKDTECEEDGDYGSEEHEVVTAGRPTTDIACLRLPSRPMCYLRRPHADRSGGHAGHDSAPPETSGPKGGAFSAAPHPRGLLSEPGGQAIRHRPVKWWGLSIDPERVRAPLRRGKWVSECGSGRCSARPTLNTPGLPAWPI